MFCLPITPCSLSFPLFSTEAQDCAMQNLEKACVRGSQVTTRGAMLFIFIQCLFSQLIVYDFQGFLPSYNNIKGHSQLWDRADLDTTFASLKSVYLNPKSNDGYIQKSASIFLIVSVNPRSFHENFFLNKLLPILLHYFIIFG